MATRLHGGGPGRFPALALGAVLCLALACARPAGAQDDGLVVVDTAAIEASQQWTLPSPGPDALPLAVAPSGRTLIDDFEGLAWPARERWVQVLDLNGAVGGEYSWGPRDCHPAGGARSLWSVGGASGAGLACGAAYPDEVASSALLYLDLTAQRDMARLGLELDIWADAAPNEGLFVNYVSFDPGGAVRERRTVYSATGRPRTWARGIRLDLTDLRDRLDAAWRLDLRGRLAYLEFLFISVPNQPDGEGIFLDNLTVDGESAALPTPTPGGSQTVGCTTSTDCGTLAVRAYVDGRCDGRYQPGLDTPLRGARVAVVAGTTQLGAALSKSGNSLFRIPLADGAEATLAVPDGYQVCANANATIRVSAGDFKPFGRKQVDFRVSRRR